MSSSDDHLLQITRLTSNLSNEGSNLDRLMQIVRDIDIDRPLQVKTEDGITQGNLKFGNWFKAKFAYSP